MADRSQPLTLRAERTRNHLSDLVESLQRQITTAEFVNQLVAPRRTNGSELSLTETIAAQVSRNPLAFMLIVAGVGWLVISDRKGKHPAERSRVCVRRAPYRRKKRHTLRQKAA